MAGIQILATLSEHSKRNVKLLSTRYTVAFVFVASPNLSSHRLSTVISSLNCG